MTRRLLPLLLAGVLPGCGCDPEPAPPALAPPVPAPPAGTAAVPPPQGGADLVLDSFDGRAGDPPAGWRAGRGRWILAEDPGAARGPLVLRQDAAVEDWAVILRDGTYAGDLSAAVRFRPVSGKEDASGGLVLRAQDADHYYLVRANALEGNVRLYVMQGNRRTTLESAQTEPPELGTWHSLQAVLSGDTLSCALDGRTLLVHRMDPAKEPAWPAGRLGLWTKADSVTHFDDFTVLRAIPAQGEKGARP